MKVIDIFEKSIQWVPPDFENEYDEVIHQNLKAYFKTKSGWLKVAETGKKTALSKSQIDNLQNHTPEKNNWSELEDDKKDRVIELFSKGIVEMPIVLNDTKHNIFYLLAGNTRLNYSNHHGFGRIVWLIQAPDLENYL